MGHVFISYVRENQKIVDKLYRNLCEREIKVWLDRNDIDPGILWEDAIRKAISNGAFFIACFSVEYMSRDSTYMDEELTLAIEELRKRPTEKVWFIPILLSGIVPNRLIGAGKTLNSLQQLDLDENNWEEGIQRLLRVIKPKEVPLITKLTCEPTRIQRGKNILLSFSISYEGTSTFEKIMLGASIVSNESGVEYYNMAQDKFVGLKPGSEIYSRELTIPSSAPLGIYYVVGAIWQDRMVAILDRVNLGSILEVYE
jgi:TIR domain